jgi:hypothetical protein
MYLGALKNKTNTGPEFTQVTLEFVPSDKEIRYNEYNTREVNLRGMVNKDSRFISVLKQDGSGPNYYTKFNNIEVGEVESFNNFKKLLRYLKIEFSVDENFKITVSISILGPFITVSNGIVLKKDKDSFLADNSKNIESLLETLIKYFESFGLEHTETTQITNISHYYQYKIKFITE